MTAVSPWPASSIPARPKAPPIKTQGIKTKLAAFIAKHVAWD